MKNLGKIILAVLSAVLMLSASALADKKLEVSETFENIERIKIKTVAGDCIISRGEGKTVSLEVVNGYRPSDSFEPKIRTSGGTLRLSEEILESNSGYSTWTLTVPDGIEIEFSSASGEMSISGLGGYFGANTASGDIDFINCSGEFEISTASGDVTMNDCHGEFRISSASGEVEANGVVLDNESSFSTASGDVDVTLKKSAEYDLNIGTASGSVVLNYGGNPIKGMFEFQAKVRSGRIVCPLDFDDEETYRKYGDKYVRKTFTKGADTPLITVATASGRAELRED